MQRDHLMAILAADSRETFERRVFASVQALGLPLVSAMTVTDRLGQPTQFRSVHNLPPAYLALYQDHARSLRHPVMRHCKQSSLPALWDRPYYAARGALDLWEEQRTHGLACGIALALHLPQGRHFFISGSRDRPLPKNAREITRRLAHLHLLAVYAQEAAMRLLAAEAETPGTPPSLTPRERECLRWTMAGKTAWELGCILDISEHTAVRHLHSATRKLGCINKHQAVLRALQWGLIG